MNAPWVVEFYETARGRCVVMDEVQQLMTVRQRARFKKQVKRLETYGPQLDGGYFDNVAGSKLGLGEFRLTLDRVDFRLLFSMEPGRTYLMLVAYKEDSGTIPRSKIDAAEQRLKEWRDRHNAD